MPFCPSCRSEFRPGFERCQACDTFLVAELEPDWTDPDVMAEALENVAVTVALTGSLDALRRLRDELGRKKIPSVIGPPPEGDTPGRSCGTRLALYVAEGQVPEVKAHLLAAAADDPELHVPGTKVDEGDEAAEADSLECPASGTVVRDVAAEECPECGLFIGG